MLVISNRMIIPESEIEMSAMRAQGAGGQNVNKVSSAIHLRFDIKASSLPDSYKQRLLSSRDRRVSKDGVIIIKAQQHREQSQNRRDALERLRQMIEDAAVVHQPRRLTRPTRKAQKRRLDRKTQRGQLKKLRRRVTEEW